jgi:hypothetical protein
MNRLGVKYGLIAAIVLVMWVMLEHEFGFNTEKHEIGQYSRIISAFIFYIFIFLALRERKKLQRGMLPFKHAFQTGALITIVYSILSTCWFLAYCKLINPRFFETVAKFELSKLEQNGASAQAIAEKTEELNRMSGPGSFLFLFLFTCIGGLIISLIASALMKTRVPH